MTVAIKAGNLLIPFSDVHHLDITDIETGTAILHFRDGRPTIALTGNDALDAAMAMKPSSLEGRRLRWLKNSWAVHNLIGHPLMQILAWLGLHDAAIRVHDRTVPRPINHR